MLLVLSRPADRGPIQARQREQPSSTRLASWAAEFKGRSPADEAELIGGPLPARARLEQAAMLVQVRKLRGTGSVARRFEGAASTWLGPTESSFQDGFTVYVVCFRRMHSL